MSQKCEKMIEKLIYALFLFNFYIFICLYILFILYIYLYIIYTFIKSLKITKNVNMRDTNEIII